MPLPSRSAAPMPPRGGWPGGGVRGEGARGVVRLIEVQRHLAVLRVTATTTPRTDGRIRAAEGALSHTPIFYCYKGFAGHSLCRLCPPFPFPFSVAPLSACHHPPPFPPPPFPFPLPSPPQHFPTHGNASPVLTYKYLITACMLGTVGPTVSSFPKQ